MSDFVFREALPEDKEALLDIRDVFGGRDYLHYRYDEYQESSHISSYLCEFKGQVIGFVITIIVDDGETVIERAARVRPNFEGKGVYKFLLSEVEKILKKQGHAKRHAQITTYILKDQKQRLCMERSTNRYTFRIEDLVKTFKEQLLRIKANVHLSEDFPKNMLTPSFAGYLFPQNRIIVDWVQCRLLEINIPLLPKCRYAPTINETDDRKITGLMSAFTAFKAAKEYDVLCNLDVFGTDFDTLDDHVAVHFQHLYDTFKGSVILKFIFEQNTDMDIIENIFRKFGTEKVVSATTMFLYEKAVGI